MHAAWGRRQWPKQAAAAAEPAVPVTVDNIPQHPPDYEIGIQTVYDIDFLQPHARFNQYPYVCHAGCKFVTSHINLNEWYKLVYHTTKAGREKSIRPFPSQLLGGVLPFTYTHELHCNMSL